MKKILTFMISAVMAFNLCSTVCWADNVNTVTVSTADELLSAIKSNTKIILNPGKYELISPSQTSDSGYTYFTDERNFFIKDISNLEICGNGQAELTVNVGYIPVMDIYDSNNIILSGLTMGHDVPQFACEGMGNVIDMLGNKNIQINNCDLYGCGVLGFEIFNENKNITVTDSTIRDCMMGIASVGSNCDITFNTCSFLRNAYDSKCAQTYAAFSGSDTAKLIFNGCNFIDNHNTQFSSGCDVTVNGGEYSNNAWDKEEIKVMIKHIYPDGDEESNTVAFQDQQPVIIDGRTLVPVRDVLESLDFNVEWNEKDKKVIVSKDKNTVTVPLNSKTIYKNSQSVSVDVPAQIINDRTMLPIRAIAEAFDLKVDWDDKTKSVIITYKR